MSGPQWVALLAIVALYVLLLGDWFHRAWVALGLALALVISRTISPMTAFHSIDWNTIFLLAGMMIFVAYLGDAGLFLLLGRMARRYARGKPWRLLWIFYLITAVISAFLDNVTTILLLSPILMQAAEDMNVDPIPLLMVQVAASNLGGMGTLIGDPPNILIGTAANLSFTSFIAVLGPAAVILLGCLALVLPRYIGIRSQTKPEGPPPGSFDSDEDVAPRRLMALLGVLLLMLAGFVIQRQLGVPVGYIALSGALLATVISWRLGRHFWRHVDYGTLGFFVGVFVLVGALETSGLIHHVARWLLVPALGPWMPFILFLGTALFSALLDNVPLVAALIPVLARMVVQDPRFGVELWVAVAMGAAVGGNATVIGASANVVAQGMALERGYELSFARYARFGLKTAGFTALLALAYLAIRF